MFKAFKSSKNITPTFSLLPKYLFQCSIVFKGKCYVLLISNMLTGQSFSLFRQSSFLKIGVLLTSLKQSGEKTIADKEIKFL